MVTSKRVVSSRVTKPDSNSAVEVFSVDKDSVVNALVATGRANYSFALDYLVPLINQLEIQRNIQNPRFYERLERDLLKGCLMPPITLAFIYSGRKSLKSASEFAEFVNLNIKNAFVLDGIQRLSTLARANAQNPKKLDLSKAIFLNILVCSSTDNLLYRMITLNNGQRPMTTRHQIEILSANTFNVDGDNIVLATEKEGLRRQHGVFPKADFYLAYMAFLSNSINVDSQKLIQQKLDDLIANKILESEPKAGALEFSTVMTMVEEATKKKELDKWFKVTNNLIGFCAGVKGGYKTLNKLSADELWEYLQRVEAAFSAFDVSKLKVGRVRRATMAHCVKNATTYIDASISELTDELITVVEP